jgi:hypothetical protein
MKMKHSYWLKFGFQVKIQILNPPESPFNIGIIAPIHVLQLKGNGLQCEAGKLFGTVPLWMQFCHEKRLVNSKGGIKGGL